VSPCLSRKKYLNPVLYVPEYMLKEAMAEAFDFSKLVKIYLEISFRIDNFLFFHKEGLCLCLLGLL
jgi:hypothetical protein